jgi:hypothetical protein
MAVEKGPQTVKDKKTLSTYIQKLIDAVTAREEN